MIKFENTDTYGWEAAIRGMRNPMNSWDKSDSGDGYGKINSDWSTNKYKIGSNDLELMRRLIEAGPDHREFMRMINVTVDITAPLYWWKEIGTVSDSCSTMHKITDKEFTLEDFSCEHLMSVENSNYWEEDDDNACFIDIRSGSMKGVFTPEDILKEFTIPILNVARNKFNETKDKKFWWQIIQLLPSSYNQKRTIQMNYEVLRNMYHARKNHKLDEWRNDFCLWIHSLPYFELITV